MDNQFNIEGQVVFVEPKWITGDTCVQSIKNKIDQSYVKSKLKTMREQFIKKLENEGFIITNNKIDESNDIIYLIMNNLAICDETVSLEEYTKEFHNRMIYAGGKKLNYPKTLKVEEYFNKPFYPSVFKNILENGGVDKILISNEEQLNIVKKFYDDHKNNDEISSAFKNCVFQQYIKTPTEHKTYIRVLISSSGDIMGASLRYSKASRNNQECVGLFEKAFLDKQSKYFIDSVKMFNYYSNGEIISFYQPKYSDEKKAILKAHNIDPNNPKVPDDIIEITSNIMEKCNKELGIICGFDFIQDDTDKKWYYLENQAFPAIDEWLLRKGMKCPVCKSLNDYVKYCALELEARYEALINLTKKKQHNERDIKKLKLSK